jgi:hypothetical protein
MAVRHHGGVDMLVRKLDSLLPQRVIPGVFVYSPLVDSIKARTFSLQKPNSCRSINS